MIIRQRFTRLTALALSTSMLSPVLHAHPGHIADQSLHSLLHIQHIIALAAAAAFTFALYAWRNK